MNTNGSYWARVLFKDFISHFRKLSDEQIIKDVKESMDALEEENPDKDCFGSKMVQWSNERIEKNRENGRLGGRPRKNQVVEKKPEQLIYGSFENVYLSQDEYNDLAQRFGSLNELNSAIENLSAKLEDGSQKSENHYATLAYWAQYRDHKEDSQPKYVSAADRTMEVYKQGLEYIRAKYGNGQNENR